VPVTRAIFQQTINNVERECSGVVAKVSDELEKHFLAQDVMDALGLVYPQYWLKPSCD
jgi:hypothetical protein